MRRFGAYRFGDVWNPFVGDFDAVPGPTLNISDNGDGTSDVISITPPAALIFTDNGDGTSEVRDA